MVKPVPELSSRELYIFSYFFDTALAVDLIGEFSFVNGEFCIVNGMRENLRSWLNSELK